MQAMVSRTRIYEDNAGTSRVPVGSGQVMSPVQQFTNIIPDGAQMG